MQGIQRTRTLSRHDVTVLDLGRLRQVIRWAAQQAGLAPDRAERFAVAVNEATTNVVQHGGGHGQLEVSQDDARRLIAKVSDHGPGLPADLDISRPPPDALRGRGLWLARSLCDQLRISRDGGGTTVYLEMMVNLH